MSPPSLPNVQRLIGLARSNGVDVRPTLLRILVDQFVTEPRHSPAEVTRFGELALHLLDRADEADRILVAQKLAKHPQTPAAVARRLAGDSAAIAAPVLEHCAALSDDDLFLAVRSGDADKALAVARREDIGLAALVALEDMDDPRIRAALAGRVEPSIKLLDRDIPRDIGRRFLEGHASQRETIIAELVLRPRGPGGAAPSDGTNALEMAALSRRQGALAAALSNILSVDADTAHRIAEDESGEPLIVVARALDLGREAATRILLFAHQAVGTSVERVYGLTALYDAMPRHAAVTLLRAWQRATAAPIATPARAAKHQPVMAQDVSDRMGARQAASPAARPAARPAAALPGGLRLPKTP